MKVGHIVKALVDKVWKIFGVPEQIVSDNANHFNSRMKKDMCFEWGIKHTNTSPHYPCPNIVERVKKNVKTTLRIFHSNDHCSWDINLPDLSLAFNSVTHSATSFTPSIVFLGRELPSPLLNVGNSIRGPRNG
ncbi:hypothetical protein PR048_030133 [Dryococelus australis]|uniref:Integrase catalytic domain-containing protein n=1 Tax=Dryococelus australis TaxID=614101 RepID=A0ABQ9G837_9NEOP|nr:hypothetical protein PR048_030133 [Dryococelus australis]